MPALAMCTTPHGRVTTSAADSVPTACTARCPRAARLGARRGGIAEIMMRRACGASDGATIWGYIGDKQAGRWIAVLASKGGRALSVCHLAKTDQRRANSGAWPRR